MFANRSLLVRLLTVSVAVAALAITATALLATYSTGSQLRQELEGESLLETDGYIFNSLLEYAANHDDWSDVDGLVRKLATQTGRRIALTTEDGDTIVDSARLLDDPARLPSMPAATVDPLSIPGANANVAVAGGVSGPGEESGTDGSSLTERAEVWSFARGTPIADYRADPSVWRLTDKELRERRRHTDSVNECLREHGLDIELSPRHGGWSLPGAGSRPGNAEPTLLPAGPSTDHPCIPAELRAPSQAALAVNEREIELLTACLDEAGKSYALTATPSGLTTAVPTGNQQAGPRWERCVRSARTAAQRPHVAPPADLYLGVSDRFDVFSAEGWWRTGATALAVLAVAAVSTIVAGRRLLRPIQQLTTGALRMAGGDHQARVAVTGNDEVSRLGTAFNTMAASVQANADQRKALISDIAHELRTPLANVRGHLEAAEDGVLPLDDELVRSLQEEAGLLEHLVTDLQDLALADAGMLRLHREVCDGVDIARQAVLAHRARAEAAGLTVELDAEQSVLPIHADPARLRQALGNLLTNATTHTPAGGTVIVRIRSAELPGHQTGDGEVTIRVIDSGPGIAAEHLPHLFDRFYRADPSRSRTTGGSGLGLAITKHLVEAHDGRIEVDSELGAGSTFTVRLPARRAPIR